MTVRGISRHRGGCPFAATIAGIEGEAAGRTWGTVQGVVMIGRDPLNTFAFPEDDQLADFHLMIHSDLVRWYCRLEQSDLPTTMDGETLKCRNTLLPSGAILRCGRQAFRITYRHASENPEYAAKCDARYAQFLSEIANRR